MLTMYEEPLKFNRRQPTKLKTEQKIWIDRSTRHTNGKESHKKRSQHNYSSQK